MDHDDIVTDILSRVDSALQEYFRTKERQGLATSAPCDDGVSQPEKIDGVTAIVWGVESDIRIHWGGADIYVSKRAQLGWSERKQLAIAEAGRTGRVADAGRRYGISRATMYRLVRAALKGR